MVYHARQKHIIIRAWPHANTILNRSLAHFDAWALHMPFHAVEESFTLDVMHLRWAPHRRWLPPPSPRTIGHGRQL